MLEMHIVNRFRRASFALGFWGRWPELLPERVEQAPDGQILTAPFLFVGGRQRIAGVRELRVNGWRVVF